MEYTKCMLHVLFYNYWRGEYKMNLNQLVFKLKDGHEIFRMFSSYVPNKMTYVKVINAIGEKRKYKVLDIETNITHTRDGFMIDIIELTVIEE